MSVSRMPVTIAAAATDSDPIDLEGVNFKQIVVAAPAGLVEAATVEVSTTDAGADWYTLNEEGADVAPAAGKAVMIKSRAFERMRIHLGAGAAAQRDFVVLIEN